jgi:hypothetical protein
MLSSLVVALVRAGRENTTSSKTLGGAGQSAAGQSTAGQSTVAAYVACLVLPVLGLFSRTLRARVHVAYSSWVVRLKSTTSTWTVLPFLVLGACSGQGDSSGAPRCTPGASVECACIDGSKGAQLCGDDGTLEPCQCASQDDPDTGGSRATGGKSGGGSDGIGGTTSRTGDTGGTGAKKGTGGNGAGSGGSETGGATSGGKSGATGGTHSGGATTASGGSSAGSGGSGGSGRTPSEHIFFDGTVTYAMEGEPTLVRDLTVCSRCEAEYNSESSYALVTYWVNEDVEDYWMGYTDMSMTFNRLDITFRPIEYTEPYDGTYAQEGYDELEDVPYEESCIHAEDRVMEDGGHVRGTLDCKLTRRDTDMPAATAHVVGSFYAEFPSKDP